MSVAIAAAFAIAAAGFAQAQTDQPHAKRKPVVRSHAPENYGRPSQTSSMDPPRMIEVRPGRWVSSWGCVWEDAQGRILDCQTGGVR
jgi:hypothetical protein